MAMNAPESFGTRFDAIFGALDSIAQPSGTQRQSNTQPQWSLSRQHVFRTGAQEGDSSDAEEDTQSAQQDERLVNTVLDAQDGNLQTDDQGNIIQPSLAFCQALDNEQEYDEADAVAGTSLRGFSDPADKMPNRSTEVLDDNVFEQRMRSHLSASSSNDNQAAVMEIDTQPEPDEIIKQHHRDDSKALPHNANRRPLVSGRRPGAGRGRSRVPHHVQHPEKYTCYILDEPLVVGGGDKGSGTDSQADQVKAARAASSAALLAQRQAQQEEPREPLPAFGSGIEFRPTKKARQQSSKPNTAAVKGSTASTDPVSLHIEEEDLETADMPQLQKQPLPAVASHMDKDIDEPAPTATRNKARRRQYRLKTDIA